MEMKRAILILLLFILSIIPFLGNTKINFLNDPVVWSDEATFLANALDMNKTGRMSTEIFGEQVPSLKKMVLWYPPLFFIILSKWIIIFGKSIESVRMLSAVTGVLCLFAFYLLIKESLGSWKWASAGVLFLSTSRFFGLSTRVSRMEILVLLFNLISVLALFYWKRKGGIKYLILGSLASVFAFMTHPIGILAFFNQILIILFAKVNPAKKRAGIFFSLAIFGGFFLVLLFYIYPYRQIFREQYQYQLVRKASSSYFLFHLFQANYLYRIIYSFHFLMLAVLFVLFLKTKIRDYLFYAVWTVLIYIVIVISKEMWYPVYVEPFMAGAAILVLRYIKRNFPIKGAGILLLFILAFFPIGWYQYITYQENYAAYEFDYHLFSERISLLLPKKDKTIFLATIPDPYFDLRRRDRNKFIEYLNMDIDDKEYVKTLDEADYMVVNEELRTPLNKYIEKNAQQVIPLDKEHFDQVYIFKLLPRDKRI